MRRPVSLFGAAAPFGEAEKGSPLNNHLASHTSKRCVVFLDEFDKTEQDVRESLLTILDSGIGHGFALEHHHRREQFYDEHLESKSDSERRHVSIKPLQHDLYKLFIQAYTPAVAGRISDFLPFFPFSRDEAAVINHKCLRSFGDRIRRPIDLHSKPPRTIGHMHLSLEEDGELCKFLAESYVRELGATSIQNRVGGLEAEPFMLYTDSDDEITESINKQPRVKYTVQLHPVGDTSEVAIREDGTTLIPSD
ncbi:P-loop containing nucleoside triphosphate hydrolase protein [Aureobasidium subglaciale]|nr:P-loop containing nucleoside triphosphate hydrolase protein [Aureobasidium subglaciale]